ncbi:MAG TPA: hypothetical protein VHV82_00515 [Sporichthyaceae bacterium]|nr:hypothetical protein [Sporichthyaceae bacterium]
MTMDLSGSEVGTADTDHTGSTTLRSTMTGYDLNGRKTAAKDANGNTTSWTLDPGGAIAAQIEPLAAGQTINTSYAHDAAGNPTRFTDGRGNPFLTTHNTWNLVEKRTEPSTAADPNPGDPGPPRTTTWDA